MASTTFTVTATFEDGVLRPDQPLPLAPRQRVTLSVQIPAKGSVSRDKWVAELAAGAEAARAGEPVSTAQQFWDEVRADRF